MLLQKPKNQPMKRNHFALILFLCFFSCEFSPSEVPLTEISKPSEIAPEIFFELSPEMDTLKLSEASWIRYEVATGERELYQIKIEVDGIELENINYESSQKINAYIPAHSLSNGMHQLKITTYTSTNSGSIADKVGSEAYWYELNWPLLINNNAKQEFGFREVKLVPEGVKVSWTPYPYADFDHYDLKIYTNGVQDKTITITNSDLITFIDSSYIEGFYTYYSIFVYYKEFGSNFAHADINKPILTPHVQINDDCTVDIQWNHSDNEAAVGQYCISTSVPVYAIKEEHDILNLNDTILRLDQKIGFGGDYQVQLRYIPKDYNSYHNSLNTSGGLLTFALGNSLPRFEEAFLVAADNSLILYKDKTVSNYAIETGESSPTVALKPEGSGNTGMLYPSPDGNCFGYFENHQLIIRQSSDFSIISKTDVEGFDTYNLQLNGIAISNTGLIGTTDFFRHLRIFDSSTGRKIFEKEYDSDYYPRKVFVSADGKNLAVMANIYSEYTTALLYYSFDGSQLTELGRVSGVGEDSWEILKYGPENSHQMVVSHWTDMYQYVVEIRDSRTFNLLYSVDVPRLFVPVAYDFTTERVIAQYHSFPVQKYSYLFDMESGERKRIVFFSGKETLLFNNGIVFAGNGRYISIDDYLNE